MAMHMSSARREKDTWAKEEQLNDLGAGLNEDQVEIMGAIVTGKLAKMEPSEVLENTGAIFAGHRKTKPGKAIVTVHIVELNGKKVECMTGKSLNLVLKQEGAVFIGDVKKEVNL
tara:strand:- start:81 stop:425 length:345 start_codon:yes stop_codon:yes gene_type:complete